MGLNGSQYENCECSVSSKFADGRTRLGLIHRMLGRFDVRGKSMEPSIFEGQRLYTLRLPRLFLKPGMVGIFSVEVGNIVKRISRIDGSSVLLSSDNPSSNSQFTEGPVPLDTLIGIVVWPKGIWAAGGVG